MCVTALRPVWGQLSHRESIDQIPAELLSQESRDSTAPHHLRQLCRVSERVRKPELRRTVKRDVLLKRTIMRMEKETCCIKKLCFGMLGRNALGIPSL